MTTIPPAAPGAPAPAAAPAPTAPTPAPGSPPGAPAIPQAPAADGDTFVLSEDGTTVLDPSEVPPEAPTTEEPTPEGAPAPPVTEPHETMEVEFEGTKHVIPKALEGHFLRDVDYTKKSQENAETAKGLGQERQGFQQAVTEHLGDMESWGTLVHLTNEITRFEAVTKDQWDQAFSEDPEGTQRLQFDYQQTKSQRDQLKAQIDQKAQDARLQMERYSATQAEQIKTSLSRDMPNYSPELHGQLDAQAVAMGFTPQEIGTIPDARYYHVLELARIGAMVQRRQAAATSQPAPAPVTPVSKVSGGRAAPSAGPTDKQSVDDWMVKRSQQIKRKRGTG